MSVVQCEGWISNGMWRRAGGIAKTERGLVKKIEAIIGFNGSESVSG